MIGTIIAALLPIVITLMLGFLAAWHHDFDAKQGSTLNRMVMLYALPLTLFAGMMGLSRSVLLEQANMAIIILIGMVVGYVLVYLISYYIFHKSQKNAALLALAISGPAVPFVGVPVLGHLFGDLSTIPIALCSIVMNLFQVPITILILSSGNTDGSKPTFKNSLINTIKEPVVWAPISALVLLLCDLHIPTQIRSSLQLLGGATGGVALFASGIILYSFHVAFNRTIAMAIFSKNVLLPLLILGGSLLFNIDTTTLSLAVISLAIPTASICVILAVQYKIAEQEMASILFFSTLLSILTMGALLYYLH